MIDDSSVFTWQGAASALAYHLIPPDSEQTASSLWHQRMVAGTTRIMDLDARLVGPIDWVNGDPNAQPPPDHIWLSMARIALCAATESADHRFENEYSGTLWDIVDMIVNKHREYGEENIVNFGIRGCIVRIADRVARLDVLTCFNRQRQIVDTWSKIVGDCLVAVMVTKGWFTLPLDEDWEHEHPEHRLELSIEGITGRVVQWYEAPLPLDV